jgi:Domain of unknown function (DUF4126)
MSDLALSIVLGIALAAATGFRIFLPMLIVSGAANTGHLQLDNSFACSGYRQPARHIGYTRRTGRRHGRVSSGYD